MQSREKRILVFVRRTVGLSGNRCVTSPHAPTGGFGAGSGDESVKGTAAAIRLRAGQRKEPVTVSSDCKRRRKRPGAGTGWGTVATGALIAEEKKKVHEWTVKFPTSFPFPPAAFLNSENPTFLNWISRVSGNKLIVYTVHGLSCQNLHGNLYNSWPLLANSQRKFSYLY